MTTRERIVCRLPTTLIAAMDAYIATHPWLNRSNIIGEAVANLIQKQGAQTP